VARPAASVRADIARYLADQPPGTRKALSAMRAAIRAAAPGAVEVFSYGIPGFRLDGQPLAWYAGFVRHTSMYPMGAAIRAQHVKALEGYTASTGTIRFPLDNPPSSALVRKLVKSRIAQIRGQAGRAGRAGGKGA